MITAGSLQGSVANRVGSIQNPSIYVMDPWMIQQRSAKVPGRSRSESDWIHEGSFKICRGPHRTRQET